MSAEALGWTVRHSPYRGATLICHMMVADTVNDGNNNLFWMRQEGLSLKARVSRKSANAAMRTLVDDGFLAQVEPPEDRRRHRNPNRDQPSEPNWYQFLFPEAAVAYETRGVPEKPAVRAPRAGVTSVPTSLGEGGVTPLHTSEDRGVTSVPTSPTAGVSQGYTSAPEKPEASQGGVTSAHTQVCSEVTQNSRPNPNTGREVEEQRVGTEADDAHTAPQTPSSEAQIEGLDNGDTEVNGDVNPVQDQGPPPSPPSPSAPAVTGGAPRPAQDATGAPQAPHETAEVVPSTPPTPDASQGALDADDGTSPDDTASARSAHDAKAAKAAVVIGADREGSPDAWVAALTGSEPQPLLSAADARTLVDAVLLCRLFAVEHCRPNGHRMPSFGSKAWRDWLIEMDRLLRIGPQGTGRHAAPTVEEVTAVIRWVAADRGDGGWTGWSVNVQGVPKLRQQWVKVSAGMKADGRPRRSSGGNGGVAAFADLRDAAAGETRTERF